MSGQHRLPALLAVLVLLLEGCASIPATSGGQAARPWFRRVFESEDFIVTYAWWFDTTRTLAARFLGDPARAWMIEDYNGRASFAWGQEIVIPKRPWSVTGVGANGYQLVPVLVYHEIGPQARGRLVIGVEAFAEQMRHLKAEGYRVIPLEDLIEFTALGRQLPRRAVVLTFDDGYKSFLRYAYPILTKLRFPATLFIYTDYVGLSPKALDWDDLHRLAREGFSIGAHTKTHSDLRRHPGESVPAWSRRLEAELAQPLQLFRARLGRAPRVLAYPFGSHDAELADKVREHGYVAAFTVRREGNPAFVHPLLIHRNQVYAQMTLEQFARNLTVFHHEPLLGGASP
jgi:peptidoglycan/xylan/chitin deacetylase (PgdA/CDA1 family)